MLGQESSSSEIKPRPITYTNQRGVAVHVCRGVTKTGKPRYYVARVPKGEPVDEIPAGYEITESVSGVVSLAKGRPVLIRPSVAMLFVGGGFGPPLLGSIIGAGASGINAPLNWWRAHLSPGVRGFLGNVWPWSLGACVIVTLAMFPGSIISHFFGVNDASLVVNLAIGTFALLLLTISAGLARDSATIESVLGA